MVNITPAWLPPLERRNLFVGKISNWLKACSNSSELLVPGEAGLAVQQIIDALLTSAETGKEVEINPLPT
jgi:predicted dehydrogenase